MIALPAWLVTNAILVAGLYPVAWLLSRLCRARPAVAHFVWLVLMAKLIVPPLVYWPWLLPQLAGALTADKTNSSPPPLNESLSDSAEIAPKIIAIQTRGPEISNEQSPYA